MRQVLWKLVRGILFRVDAEKAHRFVISAIRLASKLNRPLLGVPLRVVAGAQSAKMNQNNCLRKNVFGLEFLSPVGLAAGFDKDAEILAALPQFGFGFAEIGTVTPRPQPGNDRPRLFRDPSRLSLFNRMGFNGLGATLVSERLAKIRPDLPHNFRVGVNIGKNKETSAEDTPSDYLKAILPFEGLADYVVINVSSPNTPGLRALQNPQSLLPIIEKLGSRLSKWSKAVPILLKLAPEIKGIELQDLMRALEPSGIAGWVLTNTLAGQIETPSGLLTGGWSGGALKEDARRSLQEGKEASRLPIVSVGGILTPEEAQERLNLGADLIQIYTGWVYRGPNFPSEISQKLLKK